MRTLYVAAGGGGDAVGALLARRALGDTDERPPLVTTCAWERLRIDPVPGPRARADFTGLGLVDGEPCEVLPSSDTVPSGRSVLPRLAETSGARIFLHDFEQGAEGLTGQLKRLAASLEVDNLVVIDVGGDVLARGSEPELRSPLADSLTLAAALKTNVPTALVVLGPGADAELPESAVTELLEAVSGNRIRPVCATAVEDLHAVLCWHPTEATALVAAAATGARGSVAMRRGHTPVPLSDRTPEVWVVRGPYLDSFPIAGSLQGTQSLAEAERIIRRSAVNEIDFERAVASKSDSRGRRKSLRSFMWEMDCVGAQYITGRRLADGLSSEEWAAIEYARSARPHGLWSRSDLNSLEMQSNGRGGA
ncbi:DUF1152 domain-containing protein [Janibacter terrae]|uniref:DUF1152 domain-containing protein n=1 Tax=Janibacter terrae TaxID=103817 RepID=UPI0038226F60